MTEKEALSVLIRHAARDCAGAGQGIRSVPSNAEQDSVKQAIKKVWRKAYNFPCNENDLNNLGLR